MTAKILFVSLGCDKNRVDAEKMLGLLGLSGYEVTDDESQADVIIVNTCSFISDAKQESIDTILQMASWKKSGRCKALIATGCMAQRYADEIREQLPEVDAIVGTTAYDSIAEVVDRALQGERSERLDDLKKIALPEGRRVLTTGGHFAYLKIAEGCDKHCTYCAIPSMRGPFRSVPTEELVDEAKRLAGDGVKELILVAQETTLYGTDLYGRKCLHELIHELAKIDGIVWIRVLYCYPEEIYDGLIECMKSEKKLVHYLDLPIQHSNDQILRRMGRRTSEADLRKIIRKLRDEVPDIILRTTLICGFPGESEEQFEDLCRFINEMEFDRLGVFTYSQEEGTPAALMDGQIDEETKLTRRDELMELQQEISADLNERMKGREIDVLIEGYVPNENVYIGRGYGDAPDVDGFIFVSSEENLETGDFVRVKITGASEYDLIGEQTAPQEY
ncbi:MAG: 30S ribosomal protein S12 methylthiotransferase RimO [Lachnospiraceae bacterium]|nr:30S ribosomal protein S12 methylthiotransferase RimO [Lachnospiraceae bacterium]